MKFSKTKKRQNREKLKNINRKMKNLQKAKNRTNTEESRIRINERIATQLRINNFYKTNTGKMVPTTFNCIKEKVKSKDIQDIMHCKADRNSKVPNWHMHRP